MRTHLPGRQTEKPKPHSSAQTGSLRLSDQQSQEAGNGLNRGTLSSAHILQLQKAVGNRAVAQSLNSLVQRSTPVIQRVLDEHGNRIPIDWGTLTPFVAKNIKSQIESGVWIAEMGDVARLDAIIKRESLTESKMELLSDAEDDEDYVPGLSPEQVELLQSLKPGFEAKVDERGGAKLPGKMVQGGLLEHSVSSFFGDIDRGEMNANQYSSNIPGIDHVVDLEEHPFVQDKMHLSKHTAHIKTYRDHYAKRFAMAKNLLKTMATSGKKGGDIRGMFESALSSNTWINKGRIKTILDAVNKHIQDYREAEESDMALELPDILDNEELVSLVGNSIAFSVPSDIWELLYASYLKKELTKQEMGAYIRLDMSTSDYLQVMDMLKHVAAPWNEKRKKEDDEDYAEGM